MTLKSRRRAGFTLVEIMIVVAIIGLLAAVAIPNLVKARTFSQKNGCIANLKQIETAKTSWALDNNMGAAAVPLDADIFGPTRYIKTKPDCPSGYDYTLHSVGEAPECGGASVGHKLP